MLLNNINHPNYDITSLQEKVNNIQNFNNCDQERATKLCAKLTKLIILDRLNDKKLIKSKKKLENLKVFESKFNKFRIKVGKNSLKSY